MKSFGCSKLSLDSGHIPREGLVLAHTRSKWDFTCEQGKRKAKSFRVGAAASEGVLKLREDTMSIKVGI